MTLQAPRCVVGSHLSLAALRLLRAGDDARTGDLRRYILGLALTALTAPHSVYLRQGCQLVPADPDNPREPTLVHANGRREGIKLTHDEVVAFAQAAAKAFNVVAPRSVEFDKKLALEDTKGTTEKVKGEVVAVDADAKKFTVKQGKQKPDIEVQTTDATAYLKAKSESTSDAVVVLKAKVEVELSNGVATKVARK
jgi:hypothetical protein